ncbi:MAG: DUF11 domain-containing protein, partial [Chitinophagales bacterium]
MRTIFTTLTTSIFFLSLFFSTSLLAQPDLTVSKSADVPVVSVGDNVTFTIVVTNEGTVTATGVVITDTLSTDVTYSGTHTVSQGSVAPLGGLNDLNWTVGSLNAGQSDTLTVTVTVDKEGVIYNKAEVTAQSPADSDSNPNNNDPIEDDYAITCVSVIIELCQGDSYTLTAPSGYNDYTWYRNGVEVVGQGSNEYIATVEGDYTVG